MNLSHALIGVSIMMTAFGAAAAGGAAVNVPIDVVFANAGTFTDAGPHRGASKESARTLASLADYLQTLGGKYLKPGEALKIEVLDLDLAGRVEPWHWGGSDIRVMRAIDWPSIKLRYTLTRGEAVISQGEDRVSDQNYLMNAAFASDSLRFEKRMLSDWFAKRFRRPSA